MLLLLLSQSVISDSVRPHRRQPTRLPHPWGSPGKNTGVGCHFLLQCMKVKSESEVAQSCPTLSDPMDCSLAGSSVHGNFQARVLVWVTSAFSTIYTCMCVYICIYIYICLHKYVYIFMYTYIHKYVYINTYIPISTIKQRKSYVILSFFM